jgi:hypothetical protein
MKENTTNQKFNPKEKAIASLLLGSISIVLPFLLLAISWHIYVYPILWIPIFSPIELLSIIIGLILGSKGLKSTKKNFALLGMTMCVIGLATWLIYVFISSYGTF